VYSARSNMRPTTAINTPVVSDQPEMLNPARKPVFSAAWRGAK
jgi:hypothetical protein